MFSVFFVFQKMSSVFFCSVFFQLSIFYLLFLSFLIHYFFRFWIDPRTAEVILYLVFSVVGVPDLAETVLLT